MKSCPRCGAPLGEDAPACGKCGTAFDPAAPVDPGNNRYGIPLGAGEVIGISFKLWSRALFPLAMLQLIQVGVMLVVVVGVGILSFAGLFALGADPLYVGLIIGLSTLAMTAFYAVVLAVSAGSYLVLEDYARLSPNPRSPGTALKDGSRFVLRQLGVMGLLGLAMAVLAGSIALVAFFLPAQSDMRGTLLIVLVMVVLFCVFFFAIKFFVLFPVLVVEDRGIIDTFRRSLALVRGHGGVVFGILLLMILIFLGIGICMLIVGFIPVVGQLAGIAAQVLFNPLVPTIAFCTYAALRDTEIKG